MKKHIYTLILLGAGHSNLKVIADLIENSIKNISVILVSKYSHSFYSGMLPGLISGKYNIKDVQIDLTKICRLYNFDFIKSEVRYLNCSKNYIVLENEKIINFDAISINTGGEISKLDITGSKKFSLSIKPISEFIYDLNNIKISFKKLKKYNISIIGGGAGSVEVALSIQKFLETNFPSQKSKITILSRRKEILKNFSNSLKKQVSRYLSKKNINLLNEQEVTNIFSDKILTSKGLTLRSDINFLVTNIVPPKWLKQTNLKLSKKGFIQVNNFLQNEDFKHIFASGDIADLKGFLVPKSGVYAVRQGNILSYNLRNFLTGGKLKKYYPQKKSLSLLGNGFDFAFFSFGNLTISGYLPWILKNYIDRKYVNKYNKLF